MSIYALSLSPSHVFSKQPASSLTLLPDLGVQGDCHCGETVQHRSRLHIKPPPKNLRQVHLIDLEILEEYGIKPADLGENITTKGLGLLRLGRGTKLHFLPSTSGSRATPTTIANSRVNGEHVRKDAHLEGGNPDGLEGDEIAIKAPHPIVVVTGLRNPCGQINHFRAGLQEKFLERDEQRKIIARRAGVMSTVEVGGVIEVGMKIVVEKAAVWEKLECV